jgi:hypothetical protein
VSLEYEDFDMSGPAAKRGEPLFMVATKGIIDGFETAWEVHGYISETIAREATKGCHRREMLGWWGPLLHKRPDT